MVGIHPMLTLLLLYLATIYMYGDIVPWEKLEQSRDLKLGFFLGGILNDFKSKQVTWKG
jgi:hypothetical protein